MLTDTSDTNANPLLKLGIKSLAPNITKDIMERQRSIIEMAFGQLISPDYKNYTGWLIPEDIVDEQELDRIKVVAAELSSRTDVLIVIGIGGSYLGSRAVIEALSGFPGKVEYAGYNLSSNHLKHLKQKYWNKDIALVVISKSGTTTEPAVAFRVLQDLAVKENTVIITDEENGALRKFADKEGYTTFEVPGNLGGRYSVLSAVGLFPIAYAGIDIDQLIAGAQAYADRLFVLPDLASDPVSYYAVARNVLDSQGFCIEALAAYEPKLGILGEWWKQLYGESQDQDGKGIFPAFVELTRDMHSLGQTFQGGRRNIFITHLVIEENDPCEIPGDSNNTDGFNHLSGEDVGYVNSQAHKAIVKAHRNGGLPSSTIVINRLDAYSIGVLMYFFMVACAVGGIMMGINPFIQPGVEDYKLEMHKRLGKPGYDLEDDDLNDEEEYIIAA